MSEEMGFKPGGIGCGLKRSEIALNSLLEEGLIEPSERDDWIHDVYLAMGVCARLCQSAGKCMAGEFLTPGNLLSEVNLEITPHPRISLVID